MPELDAESLVDQLTMLGLVSREQFREAVPTPRTGRPRRCSAMLLRKGWLTSWQVERLKKGDPSGFFFGECQGALPPGRGDVRPGLPGRAQRAAGSPVAIKVLRQRFVLIPEAVQRFHKEAEAGMRLRHPNIVQIIDEGQQDNRHFMIMEYVEGMNLRDFLRLRGPAEGQGRPCR